MVRTRMTDLRRIHETQSISDVPDFSLPRCEISPRALIDSNRAKISFRPRLVDRRAFCHGTLSQTAINHTTYFLTDFCTIFFKFNFPIGFQFFSK